MWTLKMLLISMEYLLKIRIKIKTAIYYFVYHQEQYIIVQALRIFTQDVFLLKESKSMNNKA